MKTLAVRLVLVSMPAFLASSATRHHQAPERCRVIVTSQSALRLDDGSAVSVDASSLSTRDNDVLVLGTPTYDWPLRGSAVASGGTPWVGALRNHDGHVRLVRAPFPDKEIFAPRAVPDGAGWHVLFVTGKQGTKNNALAFDTATIWSADFDGTSWNDIAPIAHVRDAFLLRHQASDLVNVNGRLSFAFSFSRTLNGALGGEQGIVLFEQRGHRWRADTLQTWAAPTSISLVEGRSPGEVLLAVTQDYFQDHRVWPASLFVVSHDSTWRRSQLVVGDSGRGDNQRNVYSALIQRAGSTWGLAWQSGLVTQGSSVDILATSRRSDGSTTPIQTIGRGNVFDMFAGASIDDSTLSWIVRDGASRTRVRVLLQGRGRLQNLGSVEVPFESFDVLATHSSVSSVAVLTGGLAKSPGKTAASSYLTGLRIDCGAK